MAITTGSFGGGLGDAGLSESSSTNVGGNWAPKAGAPVSFDAYPVDKPSGGSSSPAENTLDYMGPDA